LEQTKGGIPLKEHIVATVEEIPVGKRKIVQVEGRSICIFNVDGEFYALRNICPHQGAPLGKGAVVGIHTCGDNLDDIRIIKQGQIVRCPWHGWEFDIKTGESIFDPQGCYVKNYEVSVGSSPDTERPSVETYPTTTQSNYIIVHLN
jgi:nitrite reductase (NADH) small subunit